MKSPSKYGSQLFQIIVYIIAIWLFSAIVIYYIGDNWQERGTMGDMFGAVNALFSGLAFGGILYAMYLQKEELKLHKQEIALNREELEKSTQAQINAEKATKLQVEQMHLTANLNAMNTLITYYTNQINDQNNSAETVEKARAKRRELIKSIDNLMDIITDSTIE